MKELHGKHVITLILLILLGLAIIGAGFFWYFNGEAVSRIWLWAGDALSEGRHTRVAQKCYTLAEKRDPTNVEAYLSSADLYIEFEDYSKAENVLSKALARRPEVSRVYKELCRAYTKQGKLLDAVTLLDSITDEDILADIEPLRPAPPTSNYASGVYNGYFTLTLTGECTVCSCLNSDYPTLESAATSVTWKPEAGDNTLLALCLSDEGIVSPCVTYRYVLEDVIEVAEFEDSYMEALVRESLGLGYDSYITTTHLFGVEELTVKCGEGGVIKSLNDLAKLTNLKKLTVLGLPGMDWSFLSELKQLKELKINNCSLSAADLAGLKDNLSVEAVDLSQNQIASVEALREVRSIRKLDLSSNSLQNLEPLANLSWISELDLSYNAVTSIEPLASLKRLNILDCSYLLISDLAPLAGNTSLSELNIECCSITDLAPLEGCTGLTKLSCSSNQLIYIDALSGCPALREFTADRNKIGSIDALSGLRKLELLDVSSNLIEKLPEDMSAMQSLKSLMIANNNISSLKPLSKLGSLEEVNLEYNRVSSLECLTSCEKLKVIKAFGNASTIAVSTLEQDGVTVYR